MSIYIEDKTMQIKVNSKYVLVIKVVEEQIIQWILNMPTDDCVIIAYLSESNLQNEERYTKSGG